MISVIIPVKNGAQTLEKCLSKIRSQTIKDIEIIVLDSMSTDNSKEIALKYNSTIIEIPDGTFNHGLTRNFGVQHASGELIYLTVQDAWIADDDMLEKMAQHFEDSEVQAITGMQATPHDLDKNPATWFKRYSEPMLEIIVFKKGKFNHLSNENQLSFSRIDNVNTMYRKSALMDQLFIKIDFAEDILWGKQALVKGWMIIRDPSLLVYHYHHRTFEYVYKITYTLNYHLYKFYDVKPKRPQVFNLIMQMWYRILKNKRLTVIAKVYWIKHNFLSIMGEYLSTANFLRRLKRGGQLGIEKGYEKYCKEIPQGESKI